MQDKKISRNLNSNEKLAQRIKSENPKYKAENKNLRDLKSLKNLENATIKKSFNKFAKSDDTSQNRTITTKNFKGGDMVKKVWNPFPVLAPVPAVLVTCKSGNKDNILTVGWTGIVCSKPPMLYISVRKERFSYDIIEKTGEFVVNLTNQKMVRATDLCGVRCGKNIDKFKECNLIRQESVTVNAPSIAQSPVNIECKVASQTDLGSHTMFIANITSVSIDENLIDDKGKLDLKKANLIAYAHGNYYQLGGILGSFGFSVKKKKK